MQFLPGFCQKTISIDDIIYLAYISYNCFHNELQTIILCVDRVWYCNISRLAYYNFIIFVTFKIYESGLSPFKERDWIENLIIYGQNCNVKKKILT